MEIEKLKIAALHGQTQSQTSRLEERTLLITFSFNLCAVTYQT